MLFFSKHHRADSVLFEFCAIDGEAQPRRRRDVCPVVGGGEGLFDDVVDHVVEVEHAVGGQRAVRQRGGGDAGCDRDAEAEASADPVGDAVLLTEVVDAAGLGESADAADQTNISCKDELDKGQKWYGPNRSRRY